MMLLVPPLVPDHPTEQAVFDKVLDYLQKSELQNPIRYQTMIIYGVKPNDIIKFIQNKPICQKWGFEYLHQVEVALNHIYDNIIAVVQYPQLPPQTPEDTTLAKILSNIKHLLPSIFQIHHPEVSFSHIIAFLNRHKTMADWNPDFMHHVHNETIRLKHTLLGKAA